MPAVFDGAGDAEAAGRGVAAGDDDGGSEVGSGTDDPPPRRTRSSPRGPPGAEDGGERRRGTAGGQPVMPVPSDPVLNPGHGPYGADAGSLPAGMRGLPGDARVDVYCRITGRIMRGARGGVRVEDLPGALARNPGWEPVVPPGGFGR